MKLSRRRNYFFLLLILIFVLPFSAILSSYDEGLVRPVVVETFLLLNQKHNKIVYELDEQGIPVTVYPNLGPQYNPVHIAQQGLKCLKEGRRQDFLKVANWLVENAKNRGDFLVWEYQFPWEYYNVKPPWVSGMAQGLGIEVLGYAYQMTGEKKYVIAARKALQAFTVSVNDGGVTEMVGNGWWYLEYADPDGKKPRVLNGMLFTLQGIYNYFLTTGDQEAKWLFDKGLIAVKQNLPEYDAHGWSYYDALGTIASYKYHLIHVELLRWFYTVTQDPDFAHYANEWEHDWHSPLRFINLLRLRGVHESDVVILFVNFTMTLLVIWASAKIFAKILYWKER